MRLVPVLVSVVFAFVLSWGAGCTGGGSLPLLGGPSDYAVRLSEHLAKESGVPCPAYGPGETVKVGDWELRVGDALLVVPENRTPWIDSRDERATFSAEGIRALVVPIERRNTSPVLLEDDLTWRLRFTDGSDAEAERYNTSLYAIAAGVQDPWVAREAPTDTWLKTAYVFAARPELADGTVMYVVRKERAQNDRGRWVDTVVEHALLDVGKASEGAALRQP
jgi:hypothetical protein